MKKKLIVFGVSFLVAAGIVASICLIEINKTETATTVTLQTNEEESTTQEETVVIEEEETFFTIENCEETTEENTLEETTTTKWLFRRFWSDGTLYAETEYDSEPTQEMIDTMIADWESNGNKLVYQETTDLPSVDLYFEEQEIITTETITDSSDYITTAYGIPEYQIERAMKLVTIEGYEADEYLDYLMACTVINRLVANPYCEDIYSSWGGSDGYYGLWMDSYNIADHARSAVNQALENLDTRAWDCHGLVPENGYTSVQLLSEAIYYTNLNGTYFGVWDKNAGWYQV